MKLDFPRYTERLGAVSIHAVQRIYELDSGKSKGFLTSHQTIKKFDYDEISNILHDLAIVIPIKNEKLKLLEGVLSGIPNECLVIIVSNSSRAPVDRFAMEAEAIRQLGRFMDKRVIMLHQQDSGLMQERLGDFGAAHQAAGEFTNNLPAAIVEPEPAERLVHASAERCAR